MLPRTQSIDTKLHVIGEPMKREDISSSSTESCGFILYLLCFPAFAAYFACIIITPNNFLHERNHITYHPPKTLILQIPTLIFFLFIATPIFYAIINCLITPTLDSLDTLIDGHSKYSTPPQSSLNKDANKHKRDCVINTSYYTDNNYHQLQKNLIQNNNSQIYDIDVGTMLQYRLGKQVTWNN